MRLTPILFRAMIAAALVAGVLIPAGTAVAEAQAEDLVCTGTQHTRFDPPLTLTPQSGTITVSTVYSPCVSTSSDVTAGTRNATIPYTDRSCLDLLHPNSATFTIDWNTGEPSKVSVNALAEIVGGAFQITLLGAVQQGQFEGRTFQQTNAGAGSDILLCNLGLGQVSTLFLAVELTIT